MVHSKPLRSPHRWTLLQALANADRPLSREDLAACTDVASTNIHAVLRRPVVARWVLAVYVPASRPMIRKLEYTITDLGREALAEHLKESTS